MNPGEGAGFWLGLAGGAALSLVISVLANLVTPLFLVWMSGTQRKARSIRASILARRIATLEAIQSRTGVAAGLVAMHLMGLIGGTYTSTLALLIYLEKPAPHLIAGAWVLAVLGAIFLFTGVFGVGGLLHQTTTPSWYLKRWQRQGRHLPDFDTALSEARRRYELVTVPEAE
ncbi:MAG: hypothetical protein U1C74_14745 [Phenylobacterium sp.]|nr:hypothetical protein [Phenylobacterium sp.]